jgi:hypothetical protein
VGAGYKGALRTADRRGIAVSSLDDRLPHGFVCLECLRAPTLALSPVNVWSVHVDWLGVRACTTSRSMLMRLSRTAAEPGAAGFIVAMTYARCLPHLLRRTRVRVAVVGRQEHTRTLQTSQLVGAKQRGHDD